VLAQNFHSGFLGGHRNVNPQPQTLRYAQGDYIGEAFEAKLGADRWDDL